MLKNKPLFAICFLSFLFGCKNEVPITFSETHFTSKNNNIVEVNVPIAIENTEASKPINSAIKDFVVSALHTSYPNKPKRQSVEESIEKFNAGYNSFINEFPDSSQQWEAQIDGEVMFKNDDIISIALTCYTNTGGAHGNTIISFLNFYASTGKQVANNHLFTDYEAFKNVAKKHFYESIEDKSILFDANSFTLPKNIGFSDEGIILLYNTYEIAPYATGIIECAIPFEEAKPYLVFNSF